MAPNRDVTWCFVPGKKNDVHLQLTWPIKGFKDSVKGYLQSNEISTPLMTDRGNTTRWVLDVVQYDTDEYYARLFGYIHTDNVTVKATFKIEDNDGQKKMIGNEIELQEDFCNFLDCDYFVGKTDEFTVDTDGKITIHCEVTINMIETDNKDVKLQDEMKEMLDNAKEYHSDVILECEDGQVECHKNVLCLKSEYFKNMFKSGMKEARTGRIPVSLDRESCMVMLDYFYTGKLDGSKVTVNLLLEVKKMLMQDLKSQCLQHLADNISMENVVKILEMTDIVEEAKDLQKAAEQFLVDNRKDLTPQLKQDLRNYSNGVNLLLKLLEKYV